MKIWNKKIVRWEDEKFFRIHRNGCSCSHATCGKDFVTTGWSVYFGNHAIFIEFDKPKKCNALF